MELELKDIPHQTMKSNHVTDATLFHHKVFRPRNSLLTDLYENKNIRTIYHIFIIFFIHLVCYAALHDYFTLGKIDLGFNLIYRSLIENFPIAISIWLGMQSAAILVYFAFLLWSKGRIYLANKSAWILPFWDTSFFILFIISSLSGLTIPPALTLRWELTIPNSIIVAVEQMRFLMKSYSFLRINTPRVLAKTCKNHEKNLNQSKTTPYFNDYIYFLFAPTFVYRDEYPRTAKIRWKIVLRCLIEILAMMLCYAILMEKYIIPSAKDFGKTKILPKQMIVIFFGNAIPVLIMWFIFFYGAFHSWMNALAEMFKFADRKFYQDWWNSSTLAEFFKMWNVIVYDWLYAHIYKDAILILKMNKSISIWLVFVTSAAFHEYVLMVTFKFFCPVLFVSFGLLMTPFVFLRINSYEIGNIILWSTIWIGISLNGTLYMLEYYARINCPPVTDSVIKDFFIPRSLFCNLF